MDAYNVSLGTQTFAGLYHFTSNSLLVETAQAIRDLGCDSIKVYLASDFPRQYGITLPPNVTNLMTLARDEPSCRALFNMPFRNYIAWIYPFASWWPFDGYSATESATEYREVYDLTHYFLTNFNNSGKTFYLGHWEGDGYLCPNYNWSTNPTPTMLQGFIDCLNNRQKAIDDAKRNTPFTNVNVFCYAEANRVRDAIANQPGSNLRMINAVIPYVTNLDFVSYSSYDAQNLSQSDLYATLDYMEARLPTNKASVIHGQRMFIGEYGWGYLTPDQQEPNTRAYIQRLLNYGTQKFPFILFWEIYNNEPGNNFCLIDSNNVKVASWYLHSRFINSARLLTARFKETNRRLPSDQEFVGLVSPLLDQPLPAAATLSVSNLPATLLSPAVAQLSGRVAQGVYGDERAAVWVYWGKQDGGATRSAWETKQFIAVNTNFNPATFTCTLTNLASGTNYFYRFYATNATGESWAPASGQFNAAGIDPSAYRYRMAIRLPGYQGSEPLLNFPALVNLSAALPGFNYQQFASTAGGDLRFADGGGLTPLPFEIDEWNPAGTSHVWVRVPVLSGTNTMIWAYWGNTATTNLPSTSTNGAVWSGDHVLVWHLKESALPFSDSAGQFPATAGVAPISATGFIGRGGAFDGATRYLDAGAVSLGNAFTLSAWIKLDSTANDIQTIWANKVGGWNSDGLAFYVNSFNTADRQLRLETGDGVNGTTASTGAGAASYGVWHLVSAAVDRSAGSARLYVDGVDLTASAAIQNDFANGVDLDLGRFVNNTFYFKGVMDEVRIERGARSGDWIRASCQAVSSSFSSFSAVNAQPKLSLQSDGIGWGLSWDTDAGPFKLFTATNLDASKIWESVTNAPVYANGQWQVSIAVPEPNEPTRFYRLQQ